jgi:putative membrane protein
MTASPEAPRKKTNDEIRLLIQAEGNLLMWVRTCLSLMGFGFVIARFGLFLRELAQAGHINIKRDSSLALFTSITGTGFIVLGFVALALALASHRRFLQSIQRGEPDLPIGWSLGMILSLVLVAIGMVLAGYLTVAEF